MSATSPPLKPAVDQSNNIQNGTVFESGSIMPPDMAGYAGALGPERPQKFAQRIHDLIVDYDEQKQETFDELSAQNEELKARVQRLEKYKENIDAIAVRVVHERDTLRDQVTELKSQLNASREQHGNDTYLAQQYTSQLKQTQESSWPTQNVQADLTKDSCCDTAMCANRVAHLQYIKLMVELSNFAISIQKKYSHCELEQLGVLDCSVNGKPSAYIEIMKALAELKLLNGTPASQRQASIVGTLGKTNAQTSWIGSEFGTAEEADDSIQSGPDKLQQLSSPGRASTSASKLFPYRLCDSRYPLTHGEEWQWRPQTGTADYGNAMCNSEIVKATGGIQLQNNVRGQRRSRSSDNPAVRSTGSGSSSLPDPTAGFSCSPAGDMTQTANISFSGEGCSAMLNVSFQEELGSPRTEPFPEYDDTGFEAPARLNSSPYSMHEAHEIYMPTLLADRIMNGFDHLLSHGVKEESPYESSSYEEAFKNEENDLNGNHNTQVPIFENALTPSPSCVHSPLKPRASEPRSRTDRRGGTMQSTFEVEAGGGAEDVLRSRFDMKNKDLEIMKEKLRENELEVSTAHRALHLQTSQAFFASRTQKMLVSGRLKQTILQRKEKNLRKMRKDLQRKREELKARESRQAQAESATDKRLTGLRWLRETPSSDSFPTESEKRSSSWPWSSNGSAKAESTAALSPAPSFQELMLLTAAMDNAPINVGQPTLYFQFQLTRPSDSEIERVAQGAQSAGYTVGSFTDRVAGWFWDAKLYLR